MNNKVYVVTFVRYDSSSEGETDFLIIGVFSTEEAAKQYTNKAMSDRLKKLQEKDEKDGGWHGWHIDENKNITDDYTYELYYCEEYELNKVEEL